MARGHAALAASLAALERKVVGHDADLKAVFAGLTIDGPCAPSQAQGEPSVAYGD